MASTTFDFPHPFGPTIPVTPSSKVNTARSMKDLKPVMSRRRMRMGRSMLLPGDGSRDNLTVCHCLPLR